ncbi:hypothetical protein BN1723_007579, partial [Verticillium longisporum]
SLSTKKALYLAKTEDLHFEKVGWDQGNIREVIVRLARGPFVTIECMSGRDVPTPSQPSILLCLLRLDNPHLSRWSVRRRTGPGLSRFRALVLLHPTHRSKQALGLRRLDQRRSHQTPEQGQAPSWAAWCLAKTRSLSTASPVEAADGLPTSLE